jgi:hypothetical protein
VKICHLKKAASDVMVLVKFSARDALNMLNTSENRYQLMPSINIKKVTNADWHLLVCNT